MRSNKPTIYVICAVHNNLSDTKKLLESLSNQTYPNYQIIIIDDGSRDNTARYLQDNHPDITVLTGNGKLWWTGSIARGVDYILLNASEKDFILTINSDCEVRKDFIKNLLNSANKNKNTIIGSTIYDINTNKIDDAGVSIDWQTAKFSKKLPTNKKRYLTSEFLSTKGVIYSIQVFKKIGNFNYHKLPHYLSDYEFSCRARKAGFDLLIDTHSKVYNNVDRTGIGIKISHIISIKTYFNLLFSRKSRQNIIDHFHFIHSCCPKKLRLRNYFILLIKSIYLISRIGWLGKLTLSIKKKFNYL